MYDFKKPNFILEETSPLMRRGLFLYISSYFVDLLFKMPKKNSSSNTTRLDKMVENRIKCTFYSLFWSSQYSESTLAKKELSSGAHERI